MRNNSAWEISSDPELGIFPADLHLGNGDTQTPTEQVSEEI
jgi:hypothetical protein